MKVLITGSNGLLAPYIIKKVSNKYKIFISSKSYGEYKLDLTNKILVKKNINNINPDILVHCAAFTDVEKAEKHPKNAFNVNQFATKNLINNISTDCHFIYISTDQVYSNNNYLHKEGTENPVNVYGKSKWFGALEAKKHLKSTILHTNMFGPSLNKKRVSFTDNLIYNLKNYKKFYTYSDSFFSPLHLLDLADLINDIIEKKVYGTFNLGSREGMSKERFIIEMSDHLNLSTENTSSVKSSLLNERVNRTLDLRLNVEKIEKALGKRMPNLINGIKKL